MLKVPSKRRFRSILQFQIISQKKIGCGSFGTVRLARHRSTLRMYALKMINTREMPSEAELKLVQREIRLHSELDHPHIIKLWDTVIQDDVIHMIMEYAEGGNLFYHQNTKNTFSEAQAFKFFIQTLKGVQYLHNQNIIHRDLKPQNLLLDEVGNIKICDFGWCAQQIAAKRTTFCGTYEYMAPQMLFKAHYDYKVDIWALGVLLYEMLHGFAPFKGKSTAQVKQNMINGQIQWAQTLSPGAKELISGILQFQPERRLSLDQILGHYWVVKMQEHVNNCLDLDEVSLPQQIESRLSKVPPIMPQTPPYLLRQTATKRKKNNSVNWQEPTEKHNNININLEINNYSLADKKKSKHCYHSQEKDNRGTQQKLANTKMEPVNHNRSQMEFGNGPSISKWEPQSTDASQQILCKIKSAKIQHYKELKVTQKKRGQESSKKKNKLRRSEVDMHDRSQKHLVRFNTEANEDWDPPKLKKVANNKNKILTTSKSAFRVNKH